jgi:hypothetical protein
MRKKSEVGNNLIATAKTDTMKLKITIGSHIFSATFYTNPTATAFKSLLPLNVNMIELNRNEKYADLSQSLPVNASNPGTIHTGDLMIYGASTLVLFYKTFSTTYHYTSIARIDNVDRLAAAVGSTSVMVKFELE